MSGQCWKSIVVVVSPLKRFDDHFRLRGKITENPFLLQNALYQGLTTICKGKIGEKSIFREFCREDESGRQTFKGAKQQPQCPSETALTSG